MDGARKSPSHAPFIDSQIPGLPLMSVTENIIKNMDHQACLSVASSEETLYDWHQKDSGPCAWNPHFEIKDTNEDPMIVQPVHALPAHDDSLDDEAIMQSFLDPPPLNCIQDSPKQQRYTIFCFPQRRRQRFTRSPSTSNEISVKHQRRNQNSTSSLDPIASQTQSPGKHNHTLQLNRSPFHRHRESKHHDALLSVYSDAAHNTSKIEPATASAQTSSQNLSSRDDQDDCSASPASSRLKLALQRLCLLRRTDNLQQYKPTLTEKIRSRFQKRKTPLSPPNVICERALSADNLDRLVPVHTGPVLGTNCNTKSILKSGTSSRQLSLHHPLQRHSMYNDKHFSPLHHRQKSQHRLQSIPTHNLFQQDSAADLAVAHRLLTRSVQFAKVVSTETTFSKHEYDRSSDPGAVCTRISPALAMDIKNELNRFKLYEMRVHRQSRANTHFFL